MAYQTPIRGALITEAMLLVFLLLTRYSTLTIKDIISPLFIIVLLVANISILYIVLKKPRWGVLERYMLYSFVLTNIFVVVYLSSVFDLLIITAGVGALLIAIVGALLASRKQEPIVDTSAQELYTKDLEWKPEELKFNIAMPKKKVKKKAKKKEVFYASKTGKKIHKKNCPLIKKTKGKDRVVFKDKKEAKKKGYKECGKCLKK